MNTYLILKSIHILGVIIFLGNIIVTGWWKVMANRTKNPIIIAFAQRQVILTDYIFTTGGVILILIGGLGNAMNMAFFELRWLLWGYGLFALSGLIWLLVLIPIQIKQAQMAKQFSETEVIPDSYWRLEKMWRIFGALAIILPLITIYWMVFKPV
jgi:uncharacterized membrane protein